MVEDHARKIRPGYEFTCHMCKLRPENRGEVFYKAAIPMRLPASTLSFFLTRVILKI